MTETDGLLTFDPRGGVADSQIQDASWQQIGLAMSLLARIDLAPLIQSIELGDSIMPIIDPTAYMNAMHDDRYALAKLARLLTPAVDHWRDNIAPKIPQAE